MTRLSAAVLLTSLAAVGCSEPAVHYPTAPAVQPGMLRDTATIHDPTATKIWIVRSDAVSGEQRIIFCDAAMLSSPAQTLCVMWPPAR